MMLYAYGVRSGDKHMYKTTGWETKFKCTEKNVKRKCNAMSAALGGRIMGDFCFLHYTFQIIHNEHLLLL